MNDHQYPVVSIESAGEELNRLNALIEHKLRSTVQDAIRAGEILTNIREKVGHGNFLPWLKANCAFSERSAQNYMRLFRHRDKTANVADLQNAYKQVETIEAQARRTETEKARDRVIEYRKTGVKPDDWRRGTDDKLLKEYEDRDERVEKHKTEINEKLRKTAEKKAERDRWYEESSAEIDALNERATRAIEAHQKRQSFKERIRVSQSGESDAFIDAIMDYLEELPDDNRRIEACQNIIKVCRGIATDLQRVDRQTPDPAALDEMETPTEITV